jgi:pimeloyl-ACP methyl ester carboxylesterase
MPLTAGRIFVTGLSAGGAMASVMLATYPEVFAGGAIIAGVAYGCANSVAEAFSCMGGSGAAQGAGLGARVRAASSHAGPWPRVQVWQGSADRTVVSSNADAIVRQWLELHGLPTAEPNRDGCGAQSWSGRGQAWPWSSNMTSPAWAGIPLDPGTGAGNRARPGRIMLTWAELDRPDRGVLRHRARRRAGPVREVTTVHGAGGKRAGSRPGSRQGEKRAGGPPRRMACRRSSKTRSGRRADA